MNKNKENNIDRYAKAIELSMDIVWMRKSITEAEYQIKSILTYSELVDGRYQNDLVPQAFQKASVGIDSTDYVQGKCSFKDVEVFLHESPEKLTSKSLNNVIKEAEIKR
jgi:hypothetical protein